MINNKTLKNFMLFIIVVLTQTLPYPRRHYT